MRRGMWLVAVVLAFVASGCQVTLSAGIDMGADGSGTVHAGLGFDDDAMARIGDLAAALRADDLRRAGWEVVGPVEEGDGLTWLRASKGFDDPEEGAVVAAELSGPDGPFRDFRVTKERSLLHTRTSFAGVVDLSRGLAGLNDADLQAAIGDFDLGLDPAALGDQVRVEVWAELPGKVVAEGATVEDGRAVWTTGVGQRVELTATGDLRRLGPLLYGALALVAVTGGLVVVGLRTRVRRRKRAAQR
ncbi:MAG TPA: hypothetical protein VF244_03435 [Acidimicrobiales bacterium]